MKRFLDAFRFMTIIPVPGSKHGDLADAGRATAFFPFVGFVIGLLLAATALLSSLVWPAPAAAVVTTALWVILTAGLHIDGLADLADGIGGGWDIESRLRIMKDSAIGTYGALAAVLLILLKAVFIFALLKGAAEAGSVLPLAALILVPAAGRCTQVLSIRIFPAARKDGFGIFFKNGVRNADAAGAFIFTAAVSGAVWGVYGDVILIAAIVFMILAGIWIKSRLGGLNGDSYGAVCELSELFLLMIISIIKPEAAHWFGVLTGGIINA